MLATLSAYALRAGPRLKSLDLNPVLCGPDGVLVLDARVAVRPPTEDQTRSALVPYPSGLTRTLTLAGQALTLRAIRPGDVNRLMQMVDGCTPLDRNFRFGGGLLHWLVAKIMVKGKTPEERAASSSSVRNDMMLAGSAVFAAAAVVSILIVLVFTILDHFGQHPFGIA